MWNGVGACAREEDLRVSGGRWCASKRNQRA